MERALSLARLALGNASPNPAVGAVIVRDGAIIAEGYTQPPGSAHAEVEALRQAGDGARGATMYVTLEPCCHFGRTPPCSEAIIESGIAEVHIATLDPNPQVSGRGKEELERRGIKALLGEHEEEARQLNEAYIKFITTGLPFITAKFAISLDGKIATRTGDSRWISGEESRKCVHQLRREVDAIMVGVNTVLSDDPQLTARGMDGQPLERQPLRIIVDSEARTPSTARLFGERGRTMVATTSAAPRAKVGELQEVGAEVMEFLSREGQVDLEQLLRELGSREIISVMIEGGSTLLASFFEQGLVDKAIVFIAPMIIGGRRAKMAVAGEGAERIAHALRLGRVKVERLGDDAMISGYLGG
ncbi:MAG: bifunctional diaminohydroxyphosphoribosylaminopyrimidine deaminase/5-amino-6-(5-phosphoribosylamino)uracil reductase RibD [Dehalococcoidia bacterium]|nr:bifunctional diaminohydroxyphosphoribosylaminopyrimidine deaminase/5-amino-6-(5-phosphoribosylamino)uracil reductase RibD [Dehalococcoidia bacterium]